MKKIINILILLALVAIVVVQLMGNKKIAENRVYHYDKEQQIIVDALTIKTANVDAQYQFTGTFDANKEGKVNADVPGKIMAYFVDQGSVVKKGQTLIQLDDALLKLQLESVNVQIEGLEVDEKRYQTLADAEAIQGVKLEKTIMALKAANIQKKTLQTQIAKTTIKAPFDGIVTMKMSEVGSFAAPGVPLLVLTDINQLKFIVNVSEADLNLFNMNETHAITSDAFPEMKLDGKIISVGSKGSVGNSFPVEFAVDNTDNLKIKSKMFGKVNLTNHDQSKGVSIPASAIIGSGIEPSVYVVTNGKAILKPIKISKRIQGNVIVAEGLQAGDVIVTSGFINLFDGANIKVK